MNFFFLHKLPFRISDSLIRIFHTNFYILHNILTYQMTEKWWSVANSKFIILNTFFFLSWLILKINFYKEMTTRKEKLNESLISQILITIKVALSWYQTFMIFLLCQFYFWAWFLLIFSLKCFIKIYNVKRTKKWLTNKLNLELIRIP